MPYANQNYNSDIYHFILIISFIEQVILLAKKLDNSDFKLLVLVLNETSGIVYNTERRYKLECSCTSTY